MDIAFYLLKNSIIGKEELLFLGLQLLALFSTSFVLLSVYESYRTNRPNSALPNDGSLVLVPLATMFLLLQRDIGDAVLAGLVIALAEFVRANYTLRNSFRYAIWIFAFLIAVSAVPTRWMIEENEILALFGVAFVIWFIAVFVIVHMSGRRHYDAFLLPLFVAMHVALIWSMDKLPNSLGDDVLMLGVVILAFAFWRELGGKLALGQAMTAFAAVWLGYVWLQMALNGAIPAFLILIAYPSMSRLIGRFGKGRQLVQTKGGHWMVMGGTLVITAAAMGSIYADATTAWLIAGGIYIMVSAAILMNQHKPEEVKA